MSENICEDNFPCQVWITCEGFLICRHGLAQKDTESKSTNISFECPLSIQKNRTYEEWRVFIGNLPYFKKQLTRGALQK